jgi:ATP synthase F subunit
MLTRGLLSSPSRPPLVAQIADRIRPTIAKFTQAVPAVLEIPSKEHPYNPAKDSILQRVRGMLGSG